MTVEEIKVVERRFVDAAARAQKAGFDGVELAGAHGYLLAQFLSPYYNDRTDEYGGSAENRCRIVTEIIEAIHRELGRGFAVSVRFPGDECTPDIPGHHDRRRRPGAGEDIRAGRRGRAERELRQQLQRRRQLRALTPTAPAGSGI